jgi:hypothetical protein
MPLLPRPVWIRHSESLAHTDHHSQPSKVPRGSLRGAAADPGCGTLSTHNGSQGASRLLSQGASSAHGDGTFRDGDYTPMWMLPSRQPSAEGSATPPTKRVSQALFKHRDIRTPRRRSPDSGAECTCFSADGDR